jgi:hypothetical protein
MVRRGDGVLAVAIRILRLVAASYLLEHGGVDPFSVNEAGESAADLLHQRLDEVGGNDRGLAYRPGITSGEVGPGAAYQSCASPAVWRGYRAHSHQVTWCCILLLPSR